MGQLCRKSRSRGSWRSGSPHGSPPARTGLPLGRVTVLEEEFAELTAQAEVLVERGDRAFVRWPGRRVPE